MNNTKPGHFHAVRFYENKQALSRIVGEFLSEGLVAGQPALVIATSEHRDAIAHELRARGFDLEHLQSESNLLLLDARDALASLMVDGHPNSERFSALTKDALDHLCRGREDCTIRVYGEIVDLLWMDGNTVAAVQLEIMWNRLAATRDFSLLCGYGMGSFYKDANVEEICGQHSHVMSADGTATPTDTGSATVN